MTEEIHLGKYDKDWDGQTAKNILSKPQLQGAEPSNIGGIDRFSIAKLKRIRTRPNNYALYVPILKGGSIHIAEPKKSGRNTQVETVYQGDVTIQKQSDKKIAILVKKRFSALVLYSEDFLDYHNNILIFMAQKLRQFMEKYPEIVLDWANNVYYPKDIGLDDPSIRIQKDLTWIRPNHKKVYTGNEFELKNDEEHNLGSVKQAVEYIDERVLNNRIPRLEKELEQMRELIRGGVSNQQATSNAVLMIATLLKKQSEKPSLLSKLRWFKSRR